MDTRARLRWMAPGLWAASAVLISVSCGDQIAGKGGEPDIPGAVVGELETLVADYDDGTSERQHFLVVNDRARTRLRLVFDSEPDLPAANRLAVWGRVQGDRLHASRFQAVTAGEPDVTTVTSAIIGAAPRPRTAAFVIVDVGGGSNITNDAANMKVFAPGTAFTNVYDQLSHGILKFSGDVVGPLSYPMTTCDYSAMTRALKPMITGTYQHYMWYFGSKISACAWSGIGAEGNVGKPQSDAWYNASTGCTVLVQEVGHNLGWMHSSTLACSGASFVDDPTTCTSSEYGNRMTPMGSGCGQLNAHDMWYWNLIGGCNAVKVTTSATFNLFPLETACNGIQAIQIPMVKTGRMAKPTQGNNQPLKNYYLEYRNKTVLDANIAAGVYVYAGDDIHATNRSSNWSWLLDMNPATTNAFDGLTAAGQSFADPDGSIKVTVMSVDATKAVVQIDVQGGAGAAPACMDGTTVAAPGGADCGSSGSVGGSSGSTGGATGSGGRAGGTGGATGAGGRATGGSTTGTAGATGTGGRGTGGTTTSTGGAPGTGGQAVISTGGAPGTGGQAVVSTGGVTGGGGAAVTLPDAGPKVTGTDGVTGGCGCSTGTQDGNTPAGIIVLGLTGWMAVRVSRRRRRR